MAKRPRISARQVSIKLPTDLIRKAQRLAGTVVQSNGLKYSTTSQLRDWLIKGSELNEGSNRTSKTPLSEQANAQTN